MENSEHFGALVSSYQPRGYILSYPLDYVCEIQVWTIGIELKVRNAGMNLLTEKNPHIPVVLTMG